MSCTDEDEESIVKKTPESDEPDKKTPESDELGRISSELLSQDEELQKLKQELGTVNNSFEAFRKDYSQLLTLYNETNDQLQAVLHERSLDDAAVGVSEAEAGMQQQLGEQGLQELGEECRQLELERDKYREMYLAAVQNMPEPDFLPIHDTRQDNSELQEQIRDMAEQLQELELVRDEMGLRAQQQAAEKDDMMDDLGRVQRACEQLESENIDAQNQANLVKEQLNVKNKVIEKLRSEFTELGDENTRLRADASKFRDIRENQDLLLNSATSNQDDIAKDYQALQYRCSETERREQEAMLYIKDCLKLVEQTQHEKEQLVIQAAQTENMRQDLEGTLSSLLEEASRRTLEEVERVRTESNNNMDILITDCNIHQERVAELEADLEEMKRQRDLDQMSGVRTEDVVRLADQDAVIFKLREHVAKVEQDRTNLTDQLLEVSNTMRLSKEHFESKHRSAESHLATTKEKLSRVSRESAELHDHLQQSKKGELALLEQQRGFRNAIIELKNTVASTENHSAEQLRDLREEEEEKKKDLKEVSNKLVNNLRHSLLDKQNKVSMLQELQSATKHSTSNKELELKTSLVNLTRKLKEVSVAHKGAITELEKLRGEEDRGREKLFRAESRLKAVDMQLTSATNQIAHVTENEAKLCSKVKELQLKIDQLEFDLDRSRTVPALNRSGMGNLIMAPTPAIKNRSTAKKKDKREKRDRKEKEEISKIFSSQIRSSRVKARLTASTPHTDKSDSTIKFTDNHRPGDEISGILEETYK